MASRTLLEPGRETRRRAEAPRATAARRRAGAACWPARSWPPSCSSSALSRPTRPACRCATPTTSPRCTSCSSALGVALLVWLDVAIRAGRRTGTRRPSRAAMRQVRRERWTPARSVAAGTALLSFYLDLHGLSEPEGHPPAAAAGRPLRPPARRPRPRHVRRPRPGRPAAQAPRRRDLDALPLDRLRGVHRVPAAVARPSRSSSRAISGPACSTRPRCRSTGCWAPRATSCCPRSGRSTTSRRRSPHLPHSEVTRLQDMLLDQRVEFLLPPRHRHAAGDRGVRVAAYLDEPDRRARRPPARARAAPEDRAVGLARRSRPSPPSTSAGTTSSTTSPAWRSPPARCCVARALTGIDLRAAAGHAAARPQPSADSSLPRPAAPGPGSPRRRR